jgi:hypothetical protein
MDTLINNSSGLLISELYPNFIGTLPLTSVISIITGALMGMIGIFIANLIISKIRIYKKTESVNKFITAKNKHLNNT